MKKIILILSAILFVFFGCQKKKKQAEEEKNEIKQEIKKEIKQEAKYIFQRGVKIHAGEKKHKQTSYDGKYTAWIELYGSEEFETPASLCLHENSNMKERCIMTHTRNYKVKSFAWHSSQDVLFYIWGYTYGTKSPGGNMYVVDIEGNSKEVISIEKLNNYQEIYKEFEIDNNYIHYKVVNFDNSYNYEITNHKIGISELPIIHKSENYMLIKDN